MQINLAPIGISTYVRLQHLQRTIAALQQNALADQSKLFIFSDAPRYGDEERVAAVRSYLQKIEGFKEVHIIKRRRNNRTANNRGGMRLLLNRFEKVIFLEEDVVTAPGFLTFMNHALDKYEKNDRVFSVVGFCPPIGIPEDYPYDAFFLRRCHGSGLGIWKNRYDSIRYITSDEYEQFAANKKLVKEFMKGGGEDMMVMLKAEAYGKIDAGDVKAMYAQFLKEQYTVYPSQSLVQNIGYDGTGIHCGKTNRFNVSLSDKTTFRLPEEVFVDQRIVKANQKFRATPSYLRIQMIRARAIVWKLLGAIKRFLRSNSNRSVQK
ncbi:MAG: sugar transferase [Pseudomonadota bacterium]